MSGGGPSQPSSLWITDTQILFFFFFKLVSPCWGPGSQLGVLCYKVTLTVEPELEQQPLLGQANRHLWDGPHLPCRSWLPAALQPYIRPQGLLQGVVRLSTAQQSFRSAWIFGSCELRYLELILSCCWLIYYGVAQSVCFWFLLWHDERGPCAEKSEKLSGCFVSEGTACAGWAALQPGLQWR